MKRKMKKFDEGGGVEEMKKGLFSSKEDKEQEDARSTYFKSPSPASRSTLPSAKESSGTSYNTEYKEEKKAKPAKKPETSQKFPLKEPEYKDTKAKIGTQDFPTKGEEKKYGVGPHGAFAGIHKTISDFNEKRMPKMASGGKTSSASSRGDGCAQRGKTRGKMV
jgi:hypothetical protein